ncbi:pectate lyase, partial [Melampsora americana]
PSISKTISVSTPTTVAAGETFDCQFAKYQHTDTSCNLDSERGNTDAVFLLEEGATLKNCILGYSQESVHCKGSCTVENSHWIEICDDAINFQMKSGEATVSGCSFANAGNKALQFNGGGTLNVENSCFSNVDIGYRSCGNCKTTTARAAVFKNIELKGVKVLAGYNHANGDTVDIQS